MHLSRHRSGARAGRALLPAVILIAAAGAPAHAWTRPAAAGVQLLAAAADSGGNVVVAGRRLEPDSRSSLYVARYSGAGVLQWEAHERGGTFESPAEAQAVVVDARGDVYVTGAAPLGHTRSRFAVLKYAGATGRRLWGTPLSAPGGSGGPTEGTGLALALDGSGRLIAGGTADAAGVVARLNPATGARQWQWAPLTGDVRAVAIDPAGDVLATGPVLGVKLAGGTGAELWRTERSRTRSGPALFPLARTIASDSKGNAVVGGMLINPEDETRLFYIARLSGRRGAVEWEFVGRPRRTLEGPARLVLDTAGDVYAGGRLEEAPVALRLTAKGGRLRWRRQPWPGDDAGEFALTVADVALDTNSLFVCGSHGLGRFVVAAFSRTGGPRWSQDLGGGHAVALALGPRGQLYVVGRLAVGPGAAIDSVVVGLQAASGAHLPTR